MLGVKYLLTELKSLQWRVSKTAFNVGLNRGYFERQKILNFFENRLSKLRFLSLSVMRGFLCRLKFFRTNAVKIVQLKVRRKFFEKSLVQKPSEYG